MPDTVLGIGDRHQWKKLCLHGIDLGGGGQEWGLGDKNQMINKNTLGDALCMYYILCYIYRGTGGNVFR